MIALAYNDRLGQAFFDIEADDDDGPFISLSVKDASSGHEVVNLIIDDPVDADQFLADVTEAVAKFKETGA